MKIKNLFHRHKPKSICHCYNERHSFGDVVDPARESCWDGFVRIFDNYRIITRIITVNGIDEPLTLNDCLAIAKNHGMVGTIHVIFDDWTRGDIYVYGNYNDGKWHYYGRTGGFA